MFGMQDFFVKFKFLISSPSKTQIALAYIKIPRRKLTPNRPEAMTAY